jgi:hypothetical protein
MSSHALVANYDQSMCTDRIPAHEMYESKELESDAATDDDDNRIRDDHDNDKEWLDCNNDECKTKSKKGKSSKKYIMSSYAVSFKMMAYSV